METIEDALIKAAMARCESEIADAKAIVTLYLSTPVAVGDHSDLVTEILEACDKGSSAQEKLEFLKEVTPRANAIQNIKY